MTAAVKQTGSGLDCYSNEELEAPSVQKNLILKAFPGPDSPLVCKLVPDLLRGKVNDKFFEYFEVKEHGHIGGIDKAGKPMTYFHPCQKSLGYKTCPECDRYWKEKERLKLAGETSAEGREIKKVTDLLNPKVKAWVNFVTPDSDTVKAVKLPKDLINKLWGKAQTSYTDAVPSLIADMKSKGMSPYDIKNPTGWLQISKTGEGFGTKYHISVAKKEQPVIENGAVVGMMNKFVSANVSEFLLNTFDINTLVDFRKLEAQRAFTMEESEAFAKNPFVTPQRIIDMFKKDASKLADADEANEIQSTSPEKVLSLIVPNLSAIDDEL